MKKHFLILVACVAIVKGFSQNAVAINTDATAPHVSAMLDIKNPNKGLLAPRVSLLHTTDLVTIPTPATGLLVFNTNATMTNGNGAGFYYFTGTKWAPLVSGAHYIGEAYLGGIVFWVDPTGQHGLVSAFADQSGPVRWLNGTPGVFRICNTGDGIGAGLLNTMQIVSMQTSDEPTGNFAAKFCVQYSSFFNGLTYGGWYMPSKYELSLLFAQQVIVGGFTSNFYWSSTDGIAGVDAYAQNFGSGAVINDFKSSTYRVRAIRSF
jgi:hypothetical protein